MQFDVVIQFEPDEKEGFRAAINPIRLIEPTEDETRSINRVIENRWIQIEWAQDLLNVLLSLSIHIKAETDCVADPTWVENAAKAEADGQMPVVKHPEQAVAMLCDVRREQLQAVLAAMVTLQQGIDNANAIRYSTGTINAISDAALARTP